MMVANTRCRMTTNPYISNMRFEVYYNKFEFKENRNASRRSTIGHDRTSELRLSLSSCCAICWNFRLTRPYRSRTFSELISMKMEGSLRSLYLSTFPKKEFLFVYTVTHITCAVVRNGIISIQIQCVLTIFFFNFSMVLPYSVKNTKIIWVQERI